MPSLAGTQTEQNLNLRAKAKLTAAIFISLKRLISKATMTLLSFFVRQPKAKPVTPMGTWSILRKPVIRQPVNPLVTHRRT